MFFCFWFNMESLRSGCATARRDLSAFMQILFLHQGKELLRTYLAFQENPLVRVRYK